MESEEPKEARPEAQGQGNNQEVEEKSMSDLISRADAVKVVEQMLGSVGEQVVINLNCLTGYVAAADRPTGEWKRVDATHRLTKEVKEAGQCSVCGAAYLRHYDEGEGFENVQPNYCPHCGAKMVDSQKPNDTTDMRGEEHE